MSLKIGHRSRNRRTPHNRGLARRADQAIRNVADSFTDKFETSLHVDGVRAVIYNVEDGTEACSCRGFANFAEGFTNNAGTEATHTIVSVSADEEGRETRSVATVGSSSVSEVNVGGGFTYVGNSMTHGNLDDLFASRYVEETTPQRIVQSSDHILDFFETTGEHPSQIDLMDAFLGDLGDVEGSDTVSTDDEDGDPLLSGLTDGAGFGDPSGLVTPAAVMCAVCHGYGYVERLQPFSGHRVVLHAASPNLNIGAGSFSEDKPARLELYNQEPVFWTSVRIPPQWRYLVRLTAYIDGAVQSGYKLFYDHSSAPGVKVELTHDSLNQLNGSVQLSSDPSITIYAQSDTDTVFQLTHIEMMFIIGDLPAIQVPELDFVHEQQFVDWNLNMTVEVSSKIELRPNSFITEAKYDKIWKVVSLKRKITASGVAYGYEANVRALHPYEKTAVLLRAFGPNIDPFTLDAEDSEDDDLEL